MSQAKITVRATTVVGKAGQPLIAALQANVDPEFVEISSSEYAIRAIYPLQFIVEGITVFLFTEYVLRPMLNPIAERWNWKTIVDKHRNPYQPFSVVVNFKQEDFSLELDNEMETETIKKVWEHFQEILQLIKDRELIGKLTKIRLVSDSTANLLVVGYQTSKPIYIFDIENNKVIPIVDSESVKYQEPTLEQSAEMRRKKYLDSLPSLNPENPDED